MLVGVGVRVDVAVPVEVGVRVSVGVWGMLAVIVYESINCPVIA